MIDLPRSEIANRLHSPPGSWWFATCLNGDFRDRSQGHVMIKCALCHQVATLRDPMRFVSMREGVLVFAKWPTRADGTRGHDIGPDGTVTPSIVCPYHASGCTWHIWGRLLDYMPEPADAPVDCPVPVIPYTPLGLPKLNP